MFQFILPIYLAAAPPPPPPSYTWCTFQMIQLDSKEMISAAYGMGNAPPLNLQTLCEAFYTRDIRAEGKPLELILAKGEVLTSNPDAYWVANTWRRPLTAAELEQYACLFNKDGGLLTLATSKAINLMPQSPDSIRIPSLMISAINSTNSPILRYAAVVMYNTGIPIMSIAALVKAWKLVRK